ncbi:MAG: TolC family protein, partial [Nitrospinae bacterium]|nr:TolC family protein [Nitrospinota bacterium]
MFHKSLVPVFLMVSLFFMMGSVPHLWATDFKPASPSPSGDELGLTLRQVVETTLKNNISIAVEEFNSKIREQDITDRKSEFDPTINIELSTLERTNQVSSAFASPDKAENRDYIWDLSLNQKVVTGGEYEISFNSSRNKTNSNFAGLNPQYSSELLLSASQPLLKNFGIDNNKRNIYIANNDLDISDFEFESKVIDTVTDVENVYWELVF